MLKAAQKLVNSEITIRDPDAYNMLVALHSKLGDYVLFSSLNFKDEGLAIFEEMVETFLLNHAYIGASTEQRLYSYSPFCIAYSEAQVDKTYGPLKQWVGYYSNCFLLYTEYPQHPERNVLVLCVDRETHELIAKHKDVPSDVST